MPHKIHRVVRDLNGGTIPVDLGVLAQSMKSKVVNWILTKQAGDQAENAIREEFGVGGFKVSLLDPFPVEDGYCNPYRHDRMSCGGECPGIPHVEVMSQSPGKIILCDRRTGQRLKVVIPEVNG